MKNVVNKVRNVMNKIGEAAIRIKVVKDQKAGPGLEEAALLVFIGVAVVTAASGFGDVISSTFTKALTNIKNTFGIS